MPLSSVESEEQDASLEQLMQSIRKEILGRRPSQQVQIASNMLEKLKQEQGNEDKMPSTVVMTKHAKHPKALAVSPNGNLIATISKDMSVCIWRSENGDSVATLKGYPFVSVAFSPCSSLIATGIQNGNVLLWNIERKTCVLTMHGHSNFVRCVAFDAKGRRLASASDDKTARVWDIKTGKCLRVFRDHTDWVLGVAFSPGGTTLASASTDMSIRLWDIASSECIKILREPVGLPCAVAFAEGAQQLVSSVLGGDIRHWDAQTGASKMIGKHLEGSELSADSIKAIRRSCTIQEAFEYGSESIKANACYIFGNTRYFMGDQGIVMERFKIEDATSEGDLSETATPHMPLDDGSSNDGNNAKQHALPLDNSENAAEIGGAAHGGIDVENGSSDVQTQSTIEAIDFLKNNNALMSNNEKKQCIKYILDGTEGAQAYAEKMSLEKFAELIKLKLVIAKPEDPILHVKHELEDMNERKRDMNAVDFVTSELQRLSVLPCDWMEEKEGKAIVRYFAEAVEKGYSGDDELSQEEHFDELRATLFEDDMTYAAAYVAWLAGAIKRSDQDPHFIPIIKVAIGHPCISVPLFERHPTQWQQVIAATRSKLEVIAEKGEKEIFEEYNFDTKLGNLGKECFNCKVRLDDPCTGISKELWKEISQDMPDPDDKGDVRVIWAIWCLSLAADKLFKKNENTCRKIEWTTESSACQIRRTNVRETTSRPC